MLKKIKILILPLFFCLTIFAFPLIFPTQSTYVSAEKIGVENPLKYDDVNQITKQLRSYFIGLVGGISIFFIGLAGILYVFAGANEGMVRAAKKCLMGAIIGIVIVLCSTVLLDEVYFIVLGKSLDFSNLSARDILVRLINFLLAIVGTLTLISMVIGGIFYFTAGADESKAQTGKKIFTYSIIGITVALSAMIIISQVNRIIGG